MPLTPGSRLGAYEIVSPLGAGGMGEVFRARDTRLGREVAIKVLPEAVAAHADRLARFEREAKSVAALNHPNVVTLYAIEEANGVRFLAMELVDGQALDRLVTPGGLPLARVLDLAVPLADALAAAHERGVVHRDLKPANVMVTRDGRVKVLDFGLAKSHAAEPLSDETQAATVLAPISTVGQVVGTVPYMAPEQIRGEPADARTDLFSLGILLYELLTGRRPFGGATTADVSSAILRDPPAPVRAVRADLSPDLERIVGRCLEKDPERRFQTAKDVRNELELVRRSLASGGSPASGGARVAEPAPRDVPSIAVLPFANRSRDEADEYFAEGLADELSNVLAKIRGLRVAARTSSAKFKGTTEDLAAIGRKLNVATLLEGSVRKSGSRVRIAVQLVNVADGYHLWSETFDRTLEDIFAVQDDIAQSVVKELRTTLLGEAPDSKASGEVKAEVAAAAIGRGTDPEAHRLFLQGRYFINRLGEQDVARGIALLRQALAIEPGQALAWASVSWAETLAAITGHENLAVGIGRAREAASRAMALEPLLAEARLARGWVGLWYDFDWAGAEASFSRALELAPGNAEVLRAAGMMAHIARRYDEALAYCVRAFEQDPLSVSSYTFIARVYHAMGRLPEAADAFGKGLQISPEATSIHSLLALVLGGLGRKEEALAEALKEPAAWARLFALGVLHHQAGREEESRQALRSLIEIGANDAAYQIAVVHAVRGEKDAAFEWLERAFAQRDSGLAFMRGHAQLGSLHDDPRWRPFLAKMGFPS
jgi:serine/threonine protein kinase/tetratricopeptide (TPR) repeat protein